MASPSFTELPDDIQVNILSFLTPSEISAVACTSRRFSPLPSSPSLWFAMCDRRWGQFTSPGSWGPNGASRRLYRALDQWENLVGFWRRIGHGHGSGRAHATCHPLLFFQWNSNCITGSQVSPCTEPGSYSVVKSPFLWLGMSRDGEITSYRQLEEELETDVSLGSDLVPVSVSFVGPNHLVVEANGGLGSGDEDMEAALGIESGSPPDRVTLEMYQYFANRTSPCGEKGVRRQRRRERERRKNGLVTEHFVKITNYCPTPTRPLQGLWKVSFVISKFMIFNYQLDNVVHSRKISLPDWEDSIPFLYPLLRISSEFSTTCCHFLNFKELRQLGRQIISWF